MKCENADLDWLYLFEQKLRNNGWKTFFLLILQDSVPIIMSTHFHYRTHHFRAHNDRMKYLSVFMLGKPVTCFFIILRDYNRNIGIITAPPPEKKIKKLYCYSFNIFQTNRREWLVIRKITLNWKIRQRFLNIFKLIPYMFGEIITSPPPRTPTKQLFIKYQ